MHRMATYKRRIVYFTDEEWEQTRCAAKAAGMTASARIRMLVVEGRVIPVVLSPRPNPQAQRDAILRRINMGG